MDARHNLKINTLCLICASENDFNVLAEWIFFATSHGGVLKRKVWQEVKSRRAKVNTPLAFYNCAVRENFGK